MTLTRESRPPNLLQDLQRAVAAAVVDEDDLVLVAVREPFHDRLGPVVELGDDLLLREHGNDDGQERLGDSSRPPAGISVSPAMECGPQRVEGDPRAEPAERRRDGEHDRVLDEAGGHDRLRGDV